MSSKKQSAKSFVLDLLSLPWPFSSRPVRSGLLALLRIEYNPPMFTDYPNGGKAICTISIDYDHLTKSPESTQARWLPLARTDRLEQNAVGTKTLIDLCEKYEVPMTWAVTGCTAEQDPGSYELVEHASVRHEIGVHTYSHLDVSSASREELLADIQRCLQVLQLRTKPRSFVFPWNRAGHFDILKELGFNAFRSQKRSIRAPLSRDGMWDFSPVYYLDTLSIRSSKIICKYVDLCISCGAVFHMWSHPWSIVSGDSAEAMSREVLTPLFRHLNKRKESGEIAIMTMGEISNYLEKRGTSSASESVHSVDVS